MSVTEKVQAPFAGSFEDDVPAQIQQDVMERVCEAIYAELGGGKNTDADITIINLHKINQLNCEAEGSIMIDGREHYFHIRDGNNAGTEILNWNSGSGIEIEERQPQILIPLGGAPQDHFAAARLLGKWEQDLGLQSGGASELMDIVSKRAYDIYVTGEPSAGGSYSKTIAAHGYQIGDLSDARQLRANLLAVMIDIAPLARPENAADACAILGDWHAVHTDESHQVSAEIARLKREVAEGSIGDMSKPASLNIPNAAREAFAAAGYAPVTHLQADIQWFKLAALSMEVEPIADFDPANLPDCPVRELFRVLDPSLVASVKVDPKQEIALRLDTTWRSMARERSITITGDMHQSCAALGFTIRMAARRPTLHFDDPSP